MQVHDKRIAIILFILLLIAGCGKTATKTPVATNTPAPTNTPANTATPATATPAPTASRVTMTPTSAPPTPQDKAAVPTSTTTPTATAAALPPLQPITVGNADQLALLRKLRIPALERNNTTCGADFGPDGKYLAAACKSAIIPLWDVQSGQLVRAFEGRGKAWTSVSFSPDGQTLASGGAGGIIQLWDVATGERLEGTIDRKEEISEIVYSPDGRQIASSYVGAGSVALWDAATLEPLLKFYQHDTRVNSVNFSPDGTLAVSGGGDNAARVWDALTGEQIRVLRGSRHFVEDVEFDSTGQYIVGACDDNMVRLWNASTGRIIHTLQGHRGPVNGASFSPDGSFFASVGNDGYLKLWDTQSGANLDSSRGHTDIAIRSPAFHPDGTLIATTGWDGVVALWGVPGDPATDAPPSATLTMSAKTRPSDGMVMLHAPAGEFDMGNDEGDANARDDESPQHTVTLDGFWIDQTEVTNAQYTLCVDAGECKNSRYTSNSNFNAVDQPVVGVSWQDATDYCAWAGGRLPTEAEWEYAARGTQNHVYPWGDAFDSARLNYCDVNCTEGPWADPQADDGYAQSAPVGNYPDGASWNGALDLAGNVWEWVADWHGAYPAEAQTNPSGPETGSDKVLRGGCWANDLVGVRGAYRIALPPNTRHPNIGFRCVSDFETGS